MYHPQTQMQNDRSEQPCRKVVVKTDESAGLIGRWPDHLLAAGGNNYGSQNLGGMFNNLHISNSSSYREGGNDGGNSPYSGACAAGPCIGFNMDYINSQLKNSINPVPPPPVGNGQYNNYYNVGEQQMQNKYRNMDEGLAKMIGGKIINGLIDHFSSSSNKHRSGNVPPNVVPPHGSGGGGKERGAIAKDSSDLIGKFIGDAAHRFLGVSPKTGQIIGAVAGNVIFQLGGKDNKLGDTGKIVLDNIISGKFRRKVDPFSKPESKFISPVGPIPTSIPIGKEGNFYIVRDRCLRGKHLYEDPEFPANDTSLFFSRRPPESVVWLRPGQIVREPQLIVEGHDRFDVIQGKLGNCWLMAAVANLTLAEELFYRVVPPDQSFTQNYAGIFHFQFWRYGTWVDVIIDDRLPCSRNGELLYMHSRDLNEFWSALLEKAYAKLYGSYEALKGGTTGEALEDMTGGLTEFFELDYPPMNLMQMMVWGFQMGSLFGCSIEADPYVWEAKLPNGLVKGHAYSITGIRIVSTGRGQTPLLRIRNPWGNEQEWNGAWSDRSPEWRQLAEGLKREMGLQFEHDGEFWMSFDDFMRNFEKLEICHLGPEVMNEIYEMTGIRSAVRQTWSTRIHHGQWRRNQTAGGCRNYIQTFALNPQFRVKLVDADPNDGDRLCTVVVAVMQKFRREKKCIGLDNLAIGFAIYQTNGMRGRLNREFFAHTLSCARSPAYINLREISSRFRLPPGEYVIVPSTYDPGEDGDFMLRIYTNGFIESSEL